MHLPAALLTSIPAASMTGGSCHCTLRQSPDAATLLAGGEAHSSPEDRPHEVMEVSHRSITLNAESDTIHRQTSKLSPASLASAGTAGALQLTGEPLLCRCEWQVKGVPKCRAPYPHVWPAMSAHFRAAQRSSSVARVMCHKSPPLRHALAFPSGHHRFRTSRASLHIVRAATAGNATEARHERSSVCMLAEADLPRDIFPKGHT